MNTPTLKSAAWPELSYEKFKSTAHLLHMLCQALGKLKLLTPFEPQWSNVPLWITSQGLTTGPIPIDLSAFSVTLDLFSHQVLIATSEDQSASFKIKTSSVAELINELFTALEKVGIKTIINPKPQEVPNPILFDQDQEVQNYDPAQALAWWRILLTSTIIMQRYHARFIGKTQPIGFMWGTFDLRDVRYNGTLIQLPASKGYIKRNSMNAGQIECGWWSGSPSYAKPAYYSFAYPQPKEIENAKIKPKKARWDEKLKLFLLDYDDVRQSPQPSEDLFSFFQSTYKEGAKLAGWDNDLDSSGQPI